MKRWQYAARVYFPIGTISNVSGNIVYTDKDLVNTRLQQQSLYRSVPAFALQRRHTLPDARSAGGIEDRSMKADQIQDGHDIQPGTQSGKTAPAPNAAARDRSGEVPQESMAVDAPWTIMTMSPGC